MREAPALLIYKDGRIDPSRRVFPGGKVVLWELWPTGAWTSMYNEPPNTFPRLERTFRFVGEAGPYNVYEEVWAT